LLAFVEPTALFAHLTEVAVTAADNAFTVSLSPLVTLSTFSRVYSKVTSDVIGATPILFITPAA